MCGKTHQIDNQYKINYLLIGIHQYKLNMIDTGPFDFFTFTFSNGCELATVPLFEDKV